MTDPEATLTGLRDEIDRLDDQLIELMIDRAHLVEEIGSLKGADGGPVLRPGREAEILRRLLARARGRWDGAAVTRIWREIVSAAVRQQGPFTVAASMPDEGHSCWALARDHFGAAIPITALPGPAHVVGAVAEGAVTVGIVPYPVSEDPEPWWTRLMSDTAPRAIAYLPAALGLAPALGCGEALALAMTAPEPSGDDRTLIAFESAPDFGRARSRDALARLGMPVRATWSHAWGGRAESAGTLIEVERFVAADDPVMNHVAVVLGKDVQRITVIGAYAVPPQLDFSGEAGK